MLNEIKKGVRPLYPDVEGKKRTRLNDYNKKTQKETNEINTLPAYM